MLAYFVSKNGQAKIAVGNFFGALFAPIFFSSPLCGPKNAVNFLDHDGPKKGCNPQPSAGAFYLCAPRSGVKGAKTLLFAKE